MCLYSVLQPYTEVYVSGIHEREIKNAKYAQVVPFRLPGGHRDSMLGSGDVERDAPQETALLYFGFATLKDGQRDVIQHLLHEEGSDLVCKFPTGFGKSLCYCIPALQTCRIALVVSPLCSLIQDQVSKLNVRHKVGFNLSSAGAEQRFMSEDECVVFSDGCEDALRRGGLLFCTPEKLACEGFRARLRILHSKLPFAYFVLDEAHLAAEQGYSFRSDYLKLGWLREAFPSTRICCFSATCNPFVSERLAEMLKLRNSRLFQVADARHNLHLNMHYSSKKKQKCTCSVVGCQWGSRAQSAGTCTSIQDSVACFEGGEVVIFANARANVESLASCLQVALPHKTIAYYHAGLSDVERVSVQTRFISGDIDILVATMASFGTGVDMPRVVKVVIWGVPSSIHTLTQLVGRGGRAGQPYCVDIYASEADCAKQRAVLQNEVKKITTGTHRKYAQYLCDSFDLVMRMLHIAQEGGACCINTLRAAVSASSLELRVPFAQLAALKTVNKGSARADAARWNAAVKKWVLPPMAPVARYAAWHNAPTDRSSAPPPGCMRCSTCKSRKPPVRPALDVGGAEPESALKRKRPDSPDQSQQGAKSPT